MLYKKRPQVRNLELVDAANESKESGKDVEAAEAADPVKEGSHTMRPPPGLEGMGDGLEGSSVGAAATPNAGTGTSTKGFEAPVRLKV